MATIPENDYVNIVPADANYPQGSAKNVLVALDGLGTPLDEKWVNDLWGYLQALLFQGGVTPSGNPDTAVASQYLDSIRNLVGAVFDDVPQMVADTEILVGQTITTMGYNAPADGGHAIYEIVTAGTGTADGGEFIDLATHQARLIVVGAIHPEQYGATANDNSTNEQTQLAAMFAAYDHIEITTDHIYIVTGLAPVGSKHIEGHGLLRLQAASNVTLLTIDDNSYVRDIILDQQGASQALGAALSVIGNDCSVEGISVISADDQGIHLIGARAILRGNNITGCRQGILAQNADDSVITGNVIYNCTETGIELFASTGTHDHITVGNNSINNCVPWLDILEAGGTIGNNCVAKGNTQDDTVQYDLLDIKNDVRSIVGTGAPEGVHVAGVGSVFHRRDGSTSLTLLYAKATGTGNTGWVVAGEQVIPPVLTQKILTTTHVVPFRDSFFTGHDDNQAELDTESVEFNVFDTTADGSELVLTNSEMGALMSSYDNSTGNHIDEPTSTFDEVTSANFAGVASGPHFVWPSNAVPAQPTLFPKHDAGSQISMAIMHGVDGFGFYTFFLRGMYYDEPNTKAKIHWGEQAEHSTWDGSNAIVWVTALTPGISANEENPVGFVTEMDTDNVWREIVRMETFKGPSIFLAKARIVSNVVMMQFRIRLVNQNTGLEIGGGIHLNADYITKQFQS